MSYEEMMEQYGRALDKIRALCEPHKNQYGQSEVGDLARAVLKIVEAA